MMEFIDLKTQYKVLKSEIDENIANVLCSAQFIGGQYVTNLEEKLAEFTKNRYCITCANGTDALTLCLMAYGIGQGDAIFVPTFTFYASAETISLAGATPVFVDIDKMTFNMSVSDLEKAIQLIIEEKKLTPKAIVAVDLFGLPCDYEEIKAVAYKYNLLLIEDGAQGFGGAIGEHMACSFGDISTTSFFPAKPLGCYGDGGAIFTNERKVKDYIESIKVHGKGDDKYDNVRVGVNSRLDTLQAAILGVKLRAFKVYELENRQRVAKIYDEQLGSIVQTPYIPKGFTSSYAQYSIVLKSQDERDRVQKHLSEAAIPTMIYYLKSMHQQTVYRDNPYIYRGFENAEYVSQRILNLPMHPYLEADEQMKIVDSVKEALR